MPPLTHRAELGAAATSDLEEVEGLHGSVVQPHVLAELQRRQAEGVEVGLVRQELKVADYGSQARHGHLNTHTHTHTHGDSNQALVSKYNVQRFVMN